MRHIDRMILALSRVARPVLEAEGLQATCCVAATHAGLDVLKAWGVKAKPALVEAYACNKVWLDGTGIPGSAYCVAIDKDSEGEGLNGHLVILGKTTKRHFLLDLSAWQMDRPQKKIIVPTGVLIDTHGPLMPGWATYAPLPQDGKVFYQEHPAPAQARWQNAGDWRLPTPKHRELHAATVRNLRDVAERLSTGLEEARP